MPPQEPSNNRRSSSSERNRFTREQTDTTRSSRIRASRRRREVKDGAQPGRTYSYEDIGRFSATTVLPALQTALRKENERVAEEDAAEIIATPPQNPHFPTLIVIAAVLKDFFLDPAATAGVFTIVFSWIGSALLGAILFVWMLGKLGFMKKQLIRRFLLLLLDFIPGLSFVPFYVIFVLLAHFREKKIVRIFFSVLEEIEELQKGRV